MRSSDIFLGLPYDVQQFTFLQQLLAHWLGVELGPYVHVAGSAHVYEKDIAAARRVLSRPDELNSQTEPPLDLTYEDARAHVKAFFHIERELREGRIGSPDEMPQYHLLGGYLHECLHTVNRSVQRMARSRTQLKLPLAV